MLFSPERVALTGLLVYIGIWAVSPLDLVFPISWGALAYVCLCYAAFFFGCLIIIGNRRRSKSTLLCGEFRARDFWLFSAVGAIGMGLRAYDKYVGRGGGLGSSALEAREMLADVAAGPLAALGGLLFPFCYVPLIIWWTGRSSQQQLNPIAKWVALLLFVLPALDALLLLSRSQMLVAFSMMYFAAACVLYRGSLLPRQLLWPILFGATGLAAVSVFTFLSRLDLMNMDLAFSIVNSAYGYVVRPNDWALGLIGQADSFMGALLAGVMPLIQYYVHGFFEFGLLWARPDNQIFTFGAQTFAPYIKALAVIGLAPEANFADSYYRVGIFTTFFGPLWIDFGWAGPVFMGLFGVVSKYVAMRARSGKLAAYPLHSYFCVVIFFMPVVNFMVSAQGMYVINAFVIFWFFLNGKLRADVR